MPDPTPTAPDSKQRYAIWVAIGSLLAFGFITIALFRKAGTADPEWSHYLYLYNGVQAVAFAGAGFLFGKEVNRGRAEAAEDLAEKERERANRNNEDAASGKAMAAQIKVKAMAAAGATGSQADGDDGPDFANAGARGVAPKSVGAGRGAVGDLQELAGVAERLFPKA